MLIFIVILHFREGVVTNKPAKETKGSYVNIGLLNDCLVDKILNAGLRVTVKLDANQGDIPVTKSVATIIQISMFSLHRPKIT